MYHRKLKEFSTNQYNIDKHVNSTASKEVCPKRNLTAFSHHQKHNLKKNRKLEIVLILRLYLTKQYFLTDMA